MGPLAGRAAKVFPRTQKEKETRDEARGRRLCQGGAFTLGHGPNLRHHGRGSGLTRLGGVSAFAQACNNELSRKSSFPSGVNRGSGAPSRACAWPTARRASSTVRERTG
jgi:hypothetical protein